MCPHVEVRGPAGAELAQRAPGLGGFALELHWEEPGVAFLGSEGAGRVIG